MKYLFKKFVRHSAASAIMLACLCGLLHARAFAQSPPAIEYGVKAGFIFNFTLFVEWPAQAFSRPDAPIVICFKKNKTLLAAFESLKDKLSRGRAVVVKELDDLKSIPPDCHILFIDLSVDQLLAEEILKSTGSRSLLTIGEAGGFARAGGIIGFYMENNKLRFEINLEAAHKAQLKLSSHILKLARILP